jgi:hypothetical protein
MMWFLAYEDTANPGESKKDGRRVKRVTISPDVSKQGNTGEISAPRPQLGIILAIARTKPMEA